MAEAFNPYTPPAAELDVQRQVGSVVRAGKLVRMDRNGRLPARCIGCNAPAAAVPVARTLYWLAWPWRLLAFALPTALFLLTMAGLSFAMLLFWPALLLVVIASMALRKRVRLELGICERHRRRRAMVLAGGVALVLLVIAFTVAAFVFRNHALGPWLLLLIPVMLVLGSVNGFSPENMVALAKVSERHLWLKGTGKAFRTSLPEAAD